MSLDVKGLDKLRRSMGQHESVFDAEMKRAEIAGLTLLRDEARSLAEGIATDARLPNSIRFETMRGGLEGIVGSLARSGPSIETGRKVGETPSATLLAGWVSRKGLAGTPRSVKTHRVTGRTKAVRAAELDLAWKIIVSIRERGTKALPFIIPAARNRASQVQAIFQDAATRALRKVAHGS